MTKIILEAAVLVLALILRGIQAAEGSGRATA